MKLLGLIFLFFGSPIFSLHIEEYEPADEDGVINLIYQSPKEFFGTEDNDFIDALIQDFKEVHLQDPVFKKYVIRDGLFIRAFVYFFDDIAYSRQYLVNFLKNDNPNITDDQIEQVLQDYENLRENDVVVGHIHGIIVDEAERGRGIAQLLLNHVVQESKLCEFQLFVLATNTAAIRAYQKNGFEIESLRKNKVAKLVFLRKKINNN